MMSETQFEGKIDVTYFHISLCICMSISIGQIARNRIPGLTMLCPFRLPPTMDENSWIPTFLPTLIINRYVLTFVNLRGRKRQLGSFNFNFNINFNIIFMVIGSLEFLVLVSYSFILTTFLFCFDLQNKFVSQHMLKVFLIFFFFFFAICSKVLMM